MKTFRIIACTPDQLQPIVDKLDEIEKRQRARTLDLDSDGVAEVVAEAIKEGYAAEHGGGVVNSYKGFYPQCSAILAVKDMDGSVLVTVGRGSAPRGPHGNVGPSVCPQLGCPWGHESGRHERLLEWSKDRLPKIKRPNRYQTLSANFGDSCSL